MITINGIKIIGEPFTPEPYEYCGKVDELRPYGKDGKKICYDCGILPENKYTTESMIQKALS